MNGSCGLWNPTPIKKGLSWRSSITRTASVAIIPSGCASSPPSAASHLHQTTLPYSPGYCGWNVSGQRKLFARLRPVEAGIELKEGSYLMVPIKSISGVLVSGGEEIHFFDNHYLMCDSCRDKTCLVRQRDLLARIPMLNQLAIIDAKQVVEGTMSAVKVTLADAKHEIALSQDTMDPMIVDVFDTID